MARNPDTNSPCVITGAADGEVAGKSVVERNRYADLLRVCAIGAVVLGHWLATDVTCRGGPLSGLDALYYVSWGRWLTLFFRG